MNLVLITIQGNPITIFCFDEAEVANIAQNLMPVWNDIFLLV